VNKLPRHELRATRLTAALAALTLACLVGAVVVAGKVKIDVQHDPTFDFRPLKTWAWHPDGAGDVKMLVSADDDPAQVKEQLEPIITQAVERELAKRGLVRAAAGTAPDVHVLYYVLISTGDTSQAMGQFINSPAWGLPPISGGTTHFRAYEQGSLVLDLIAVSVKSTVWRGVAKAEIDRRRSAAERQKRIEDSVKDMLAKYPPKQKR
jgi:hypothetical protein